MKNFITILAFAGIIFFAACGGDKRFPGYDQAENGTFFLLHKKGAGTNSVDTGGAVFLKIKFKTIQDSVFLDINEATHAPSYPMRVDKPAFKGDFLDMFTRLHVGDSASFFVSLDSLKAHYKEEFKFDARHDTMKYLGFVVSVDSIYSREKVQDLRTKAEAEQKKQQEMMMAMQAEEPAAIAKYIADNKITVKPTPDGIYYIETQKGKGDNIKDGQDVKLMYTGKFTDGQIFDSNQKAGGQPLEFIVGQHQVIPGMEEAITMMKKGGKATWVIPSALAYRDGGGRFKPFATLIFDIEVVDVTNAPPQQQQMQMPPTR